ncbi:phosphate ABC transporter permease subunit PstC [Rothia sp. P7208]|uniref:phosphate ABC transporter permease subunit PstC n=1 Tax=Rothia sp. P7208 TaxID=3402660 RepID=UPI003ABF2987
MTTQIRSTLPGTTETHYSETPGHGTNLPQGSRPSHSATPNPFAQATHAGSPATDKIFSGISLSAGILILAVLASVAIFLIIQAAPVFSAPAAELTEGSFWSYIYPLAVGTLIASAIALLLATPMGIGIALYISHYAPKKIAKPVSYLIDLLTAIPSVIFGAWGAMVLAPHVVPIYDWLGTHMGWMPIFSGATSQTGKTILTAGVVLGIMILPIITSMCRELFIQTPKLQQEAALGLGATRWEMIRMTVLPFARNGIISSVMLALGRALGETMAVTLVLSGGPLTASIISSGNQTFASDIALNFPEAYGLRMSELIAAGLVLFVITLIVNIAARLIVSRYRKKA